ncbi:MAG: UDP-N-acetylmuramate--alanine ligase, partial [Candidatus Saccharimonadales bacterium]
MQHVYFIGIGGSGIGPLAMLSLQAGYKVSGSDNNESDYIDKLKSKGVENISTVQDGSHLNAVHTSSPIDIVIRSSAVPDYNPDVVAANQLNIPVKKRDDLINKVLEDSGQKMIAVAGTHGKTTTTAMVIWMFKELGIPVSYSVGAKLPFGHMGEFDAKAEYFIYEADEYDRNFLSFKPYMSLISGIGYDHPDIYPTKDDYNSAFKEFIGKSEWTIAHEPDLKKLSIEADWHIFSPGEALKDAFDLTGQVIRENAQIVVQGVSELVKQPSKELVSTMNRFPGISRRFEQITKNVYSDYAHTPEKILGAIQIASEISKDIIVVYEGLHNTRQHFIISELHTLFHDAKKLYIAPSYLAREDESLELLTPEKLCQITTQPTDRSPVRLDDSLLEIIKGHAASGDLVLCLTAGGSGSLDEWLR